MTAIFKKPPFVFITTSLTAAILFYQLYNNVISIQSHFNQPQQSIKFPCMKRLILSALVFLFIGAHAQVDIIPQPVEVVMPNQAGTFTITAKTPIKLEGSGL